MENSIDQLLLRAVNTPQDESIYLELKNLIDEPESIIQLINIAESTNSPLNIRILSLILIRQIISINFNSFSEENYVFLIQISEQIEKNLTPIFFSPSNLAGLVSQYAALCSFLNHQLNFLYYIGITDFHLTNLQPPSFYSNITEILNEIIENDEIRQNSFLIMNEFLMYSNENQMIRPEFCQKIYPFVFQTNFQSNSIQILNALNDFSIIPTIFENLDQLNQKESIIQFIKMLNSFYLSIINSINDGENLNSLQLFDVVFEFLLKCMSENDEEELNSISLEAALFIFNLFRSFSKNLNTLFGSHLNDLFNCLFEKVGIDKNTDFFGISRISLKIIQMILILFPQESSPFIFSKIQSIFSNASNSTDFSLIQCTLRTFSKILSIKTIKTIYYFSLLDMLKLAIESSMHFIQIPELAADSSILFSKSLKFIFFIQNLNSRNQTQKIQNMEEIQEFDIVSIGNNGFKQIIQAYSIFDLEVKKKLTKSIFSILKFLPISLNQFLTDLVQIFVDSKSIHEYVQNSYLLGFFIEKSIKESDLKSEFHELIQFVMNSMTNESNLFLISSLHIISSSLLKCPELAPFVVSSIWQKIVEITNSFEFSSFFLYERKLNYDNISTFSWIIQLLIVVNKTFFSLNMDSSQLFEPVIVQIQSFLNPSLPKSVNRASWIFLSNFIDVAIKNSHKNQADNEEKQTKMITELFLIVKNSVLSLFEWSIVEGEKNENENEDDFVSLSISIIGIVAQTLFLILKELKFSNAGENDENSLLFSQPNEMKMAASFLLNLFGLQQSSGIKNFEAAQAVTCCVCLMVQFPGGAEQIAEIVDADLMSQIIHIFSEINYNDLKQFIAPGISTIMMLNSVEQV